VCPERVSPGATPFTGRREFSGCGADYGARTNVWSFGPRAFNHCHFRREIPHESVCNETICFRDPFTRLIAAEALKQLSAQGFADYNMRKPDSKGWE
jgi:hypothetical protein